MSSANQGLLKVRLKKLSNFWQGVIWRLYSLLVFFGLYSPRKYWGIIYDSVTKQPLDPAVAKLVYANRDKVQTCITDLNGRYGFLAEPGRFKILVKKDNFKFPSEIVKGDRDGVYEGLYHGEFLELHGGSEVIAPNIPLDPLGFDWNQQAKESRIGYSPYLLRLGKALVQTVFWTAFALILFLSVISFPKIPLILLSIFAGYLLLFLLVIILPEPRLWGQINQQADNETLAHYQLELKNSTMPGTLFDRISTNEEGKFFLLAQPGTYILHIKKIDRHKNIIASGSIEIEVPSSGVLTQSFLLY